MQHHHHVLHFLRNDPSPIFQANGLIVLFITGFIGELDWVVLLRILIEVVGINPTTVQLSKANLVRSKHLGGFAYNLGGLFG